MSYRVRAARITYHDSEGRRRDDTRFGFLIEDVDDVARRNDREELDIATLGASQLDPRAAARFSLAVSLTSRRAGWWPSFLVILVGPRTGKHRWCFPSLCSRT
jgi:hypothetical protein